MVIGFSRLDGRTVGFVANQPLFLAGSIDVDAADRIRCTRESPSHVAAWDLEDYFRVYKWNVLGDPPPHVRLEMVPHLENFRPHGEDQAPPGPGTEPFIVPPTWNKTQHHEGIASVWRAAARHLSEAEHIFVVGYSLPETDLFFRYLYALGTLGPARLKRFWVFAPDTSGQVEQRFRALLGAGARDRFKYAPEPFDRGLNQIGEALAKP